MMLPATEGCRKKPRHSQTVMGPEKRSRALSAPKCSPLIYTQRVHRGQKLGKEKKPRSCDTGNEDRWMRKKRKSVRALGVRKCMKQKPSALSEVTLGV